MTRLGVIFTADRPPEQLPAFAAAAESAGLDELWLAGDAAAFVTGQDIVVDGGITAGRPISVSVNERAQLAQAFTALREAS